ncbi:hypothetical protein ACFV1N_46190 [Streptosporangium canum]|uniref:hypothetical protein n=1 Tax=Streptosporangium canum TaxID=324952 RepID=UPI0036742DEF
MIPTAGTLAAEVLCTAVPWSAAAYRPKVQAAAPSSDLAVSGKFQPEIVDLPPAVQMALRLAVALGRGHGIIADVQPFLLNGEALISVWVGLVVHTDGCRFRWIVPGSQRRRGKPLWTYARKPSRAAARLAVVYAGLRAQPVVDTILGGPLLADALLEHGGEQHVAAPR